MKVSALDESRQLSNLVHDFSVGLSASESAAEPVDAGILVARRPGSELWKADQGMKVDDLDRRELVPSPGCLKIAEA